MAFLHGKDIVTITTINAKSMVKTTALRAAGYGNCACSTGILRTANYTGSSLGPPLPNSKFAG